ncbi:GNAT family protein [Bacillus sp. 165]|uniref:GNAT family N-acetyltransferase n=1 Tax=Bacillus sp. 165 TaxID=1529117 RepID=UPI001ADCE5D2|nr:GNAT family protein [Bacillus sp. 165]MBO9130874.1 GNAT family N-acetyltransferase [Bacillus sp. 165]
MNGNKIFLMPLDESLGEAVLELQRKNRSFFEQTSIERNNDFFTLEGQLQRIKKSEENSNQDKGYSFGIFLNDTQELIGEISLFKIERGPAQTGMVGYSLDKEHNGNGYMTEAVNLIVNYAFHDLKLHRIEAGVMPHNLGSIKVLEKSGFQKEGIARKNVKINGKWEDHQMLAIINDDIE